jgi:hypothetical protein
LFSMRTRPALFVVLMAVVLGYSPVLSAQAAIPVDPADAGMFAAELAARAARLEPLLDEVPAGSWIERGAPQAYEVQWTSLTEQNRAIHVEMTAVSQHPEAMQDVMRALFRVQRFDRDLDSLLIAVRRYQTSDLADRIEGISAADQRQIERLQQYVLDLADDTEKQLALVNREAQRCRGLLACQPVAAHPAATKPAAKAAAGNTKESSTKDTKTAPK